MIQIIAFLYAGERGLDGLRSYESQAIPILKEHGGVLVSASSSDQQDEGPDEIHVIQFPNMEAFDNFRADPRHVELSGLREACIAKTTLHITDIFHEYL